MNIFLMNVGFFAVCVVIVIAYKKILSFYYQKRLEFLKDNNVYKAAEKFADGASVIEVKRILVSCFDLNEKNVEEILSQSLSHRTDKDGGYRYFIRSVNKVLGEDIYSEKTSHKIN